MLHLNHEASQFPGGDVLSPALHAVQPWTGQERHRMFCTHWKIFLGDVGQGLDDLQLSPQTPAGSFETELASC